MRLMIISVIGVLLASSYANAGSEIRLPKDKYLDKCQGAWAGQMIGVCYGAPYEFRFNGQIIEEDLKPWNPEHVAGAIDQDDCYVEMTFLMALEKDGLDITFEQAGKAFADSKYSLCHANRWGRENCRRGIMPPKSGSPEYNRHADDIDFQIESDLLGIICPGMPRESNRLCDIFGHIMNYGDGVYGGMFVAGMYTAAYFEDNDVSKVVEAGLACIPKESEYHKCISDVITWHHEHPDDWKATWKKLEEKWQDDVDCMPGIPFNIDARINGAYITVGLLYGGGDFLKTIEIATRCGQDADCNPSSAAGIIGCMKGYRALGDKLTGGIAAIEDKKFSYTNYSFKTLTPACQRMTEKLVKHIGGKVEDDSFLIPVQAAKPAKLEQWKDQKALVSVAIMQTQLDSWMPGWKLVACGFEMDPGVVSEELGRKNVLMLHPVSPEKPAVIASKLKVPDSADPNLYVDVSSDKHGDFLLKIYVNDQPALEKIIGTKGKWQTEKVPLTGQSGKDISVRIENHRGNEWGNEAAYLNKVEIR